MGLEPLIRPERPEDCSVIGAVIRAAFAGKPYAAGDEAELVEALRRKHALTVSFVAELHGAVIGQIAFSPAFASDGTGGWCALGPVSVLPEYQGRDIGGTLVRKGLEAVTKLGASGCILTGDPRYYARFGFTPAPSNAPPGEPPEYFMIKLLAGQRPTGAIRFDDAFHGAS